MEFSDAEQEAIHGAIHRLEQRWTTVSTDPLWHVYDRLPFWEFIAGMRQAAQLTDGRRFVDLGCGIGTNVAIAYHLGWQVSGVEKRPEYVAAASDLVPEGHFVESELLELEEVEADVIYMYRPARSDELEDALESHIADLLEPGTVCFWPYRHDPDVWLI